MYNAYNRIYIYYRAHRLCYILIEHITARLMETPTVRLQDTSSPSTTSGTAFSVVSSPARVESSIHLTQLIHSSATFNLKNSERKDTRIEKIRKAYSTWICRSLPKFLSPSVHSALHVHGALFLCRESPNGCACHASGCPHPLLMKRCQEISWRKGDQMQRLFPFLPQKCRIYPNFTKFSHTKLRET